MKQTPFTHKHIALGAKMHEFAGYNMPIEYSGINDEHLCVRNGVGVFDVSHMGEFWVEGEQALYFLQRITTNDVSKLSIGKAQYSCFTNTEGGIIDDLLVYYYEKNKYLLVVNASNIEKDWNWCIAQNNGEVNLENASNHIAQLAVQGPLALATLQKMTDVDLSSIPYYSFVVGKMNNEKVIISNTGYTGAGGFEIYMYNEAGSDLWDALFKAGAEFGIKAIGLGARDTLRLEKGFCLYGNDLNDTTTPLEAGLGWITKLEEGKNFTGRAILEAQKQVGVTRRLRGFILQERGIPRQGYTIVNQVGEKIGEVTSGTMSPVLKEGIGMGYIDMPYGNFDTEVYVQVRNKNLRAKIVKLPFV